MDKFYSKGCGRLAAPGQWFRFCGDRDMCCDPVLCPDCGGDSAIDWMLRDPEMQGPSARQPEGDAP